MDENGSSSSQDAIDFQRDALIERLNEAGAASMELAAVYLGERLGLYRAIAERGPLKSAELAETTGTHERYAREWLEGQTISGILDCENPEAPPTDRRFALPAGHAEALANDDNLNYWAAQARIFMSLFRVTDQVLDAFRTGAGVPFSSYEADFRDGMADSSRLAYLEMMGSTWIPAMPDVHERLQTSPPAQVADIGVGAGWTSIAIARSYPHAHVDGFDLDPASVEIARRNVEQAGLSDRVTFQLRDASDPELAGDYDLVLAFFCVHDMAQPVSALKTMHQLAGERGTVLIAEPRGAERFLDPAADRLLERQLYGFSVLHCLPVSMTEAPSAATGTVVRPSMMREYAREAGFRDAEVLPIDDPFGTFYRLRQ